MQDDDPAGVVRRIAGYGLRATEGTIEIPAGAWPSLLKEIADQQLSGIASAAVADRALRLTDGQAEALRRIHRDATVRTLALERATLHLARAFGDEAIDLVVIKGSALAHRFYADPAMRPFGDVDLLVRTADWHGACALLRRLGFERSLPEPRRGFDERFGKAAVHTSASGISVDLHRTLVLGPFGLWIRAEELFDRTEPVTVAGVSFRALDHTAALLNAMLHASLGARPPLLLPLRDVAQILGRGTIDWDDLARLTVLCRAQAVVQHALRAVRDGLGVSLPAEADRLLRASPPKRELRALDSYVTNRRSRGGTLRATFAAVPGTRAKVALLRDVLLPDRAFLAARSEPGRPASYARRWATPLRWLLRRPS